MMVTTPETVDRRISSSASGWVGAGGGVLAFIAVLLPWVTFTGVLHVSRNATQLGPRLTLDSNGVLLLAVAGAWVAWGAWDAWEPSGWGWPLIRAAAGALLLVLIYNSLTGLIHQVQAPEWGAVGAGYWLFWLAVAAQAISAFLAWHEAKQRLVVVDDVD